MCGGNYEVLARMLAAHYLNRVLNDEESPTGPGHCEVMLHLGSRGGESGRTLSPTSDSATFNFIL